MVDGWVVVVEVVVVEVVTETCRVRVPGDPPDAAGTVKLPCQVSCWPEVVGPAVVAPDEEPAV